MTRALLGVLLLIAALAPTPAVAGKARVRTLAYVVSECRSDAAGLTGRQELRIRRGNRPPVTVMAFEPGEPVPDPLALCRNFGEYRNGQNSMVAAPLQRLGVSPDGSTVVFEVTSEFAVFPLVTVPPGREGIYVVRADGRGLRRLGPPSRDPMFRVVPEPSSPIGVFFLASGDFSFSPDGRKVVYTDIGPGPSGEDTIQVVTLTLASGDLGRDELSAQADAIADPFFFQIERNDIVDGSFGLRWRFAESAVVAANAIIPINLQGLRPDVIPTLEVEYVF